MADIFDGSEDKVNQTSGDNTEVNYLDVAKEKFKQESGELDIEGLARGKYESDSHINNLESENNQLREDLDSRTNMQQFLDKLEELRPRTSSGNNQTHESESQESVDETSGLSADDVEKLINSRLTATQEGLTRESNINKSISAMKNAWGNNYRDTIDSKAHELGVGKDFLNNLAASHPTAFIKLVGADVTKEPLKPSSVFEAPRSTHNVNMTNIDGTKRNYAYYSKMRKDNPQKYHSVENTREMHRLAGSMGDDFYN